jgi:hypothetical protein
MFPRLSSVLRIVAAFLSYVSLAAPAHAADIVYAGGGALSQIVDGGGISTILTLINLDSSAAPYTLYFYDNNGNPLRLSTSTMSSTTADAPASILAGTLGPNASTIILTNGGGGTILQGWALLVTNNTIAGSAVFGIPLNGQIVQASCPLDTGQDFQFGLPFDHTTSVTGVAIANSWITTPLTVSITILDLNGNQILTDTITIPGSGHTSFMLTDRYPQLAGLQGFALFSGSYYMNVLGLRATATTFTSITPIVAGGW